MSIKSIKNYFRQLFLPRNKLLIFNFHQVSKLFDPGKHIEGIWTQSDHFYDQIRYLKKNFQIVPLNEVLQELGAGKLHSTKVALTFDDGDKSIEKFVIPFLESEKIPASFFINTAYLDSTHVCWTDLSLYMSKSDRADSNKNLLEKVKIARNTLDKSQYLSCVKELEKEISISSVPYTRYSGNEFIKKLNPELFNIGLHGHEHHRVGLYSAEWQQENLQKNIDVLASYPAYIPVFAIPFGKPIDWNQSTLDICQELGVTPLFANGGYSTNKHPVGHRIPADARNVASLIISLSPDISRYG